MDIKGAFERISGVRAYICFADVYIYFFARVSCKYLQTCSSVHRRYGIVLTASKGIKYIGT